MSKVLLPKGIRIADTKYRHSDLTDGQYKKLQALGYHYEHSFEVWLVDDEWLIPTLTISNAGRRAVYQRRTYAVGVADSKVYRVGQGPHVVETHTVYLTRASFDRLYPYMVLRAEGAKKANSVRDRISSRRAQGQLYRAAGRTSWRW